MFMILRCIGASGTTGASTTRDKKQEKAQEDLSKQLQYTKRYEKHDHMLQGKLLQKTLLFDKIEILYVNFSMLLGSDGNTSSGGTDAGKNVYV